MTHVFLCKMCKCKDYNGFIKNTFESIYTFVMYVKFIINQNDPVSTENNLSWMKTTTTVPYSLHLLSVQENFTWHTYSQYC